MDVKWSPCFSVDGRRLKNGLLVVILRSLPQADDEESERNVKRKGEDSVDENKIKFPLPWGNRKVSE